MESLQGVTRQAGRQGPGCGGDTGAPEAGPCGFAVHDEDGREASRSEPWKEVLSTFWEEG